MSDFTNIWDVTQDTAHPRARKLLGDSVLWDYGDEDSPLGNDTGADVFAAYLRLSSSPNTAALRAFLDAELRSRGIENAGWDMLQETALQNELAQGKGAALVARDDVIVAMAFSQLLVEGCVNETIRQLAIKALERQSTQTVLAFRGGAGKDARKAQLAEFRRILHSLTN